MTPAPLADGEPAEAPQLPLDADALERALLARGGQPARRWLQQARARLAESPDAIAMLFPAAGRAAGRGPLHAADRAQDLHAWTLDAAARTLLLVALGAGAERQLAGLYRHGDAAERCGVLRALAFLDVQDGAGVPLVLDALRSNDLRMIAAALSPYALTKLDDDALCQAVLKCVFTGVPLAGIAGLERRATAQMASVLARYAHERIAAGRAVPAEVWPLIDRFPPAAELRAIEAELQRPEPERRTAARVALAGRAAQAAAAADRAPAATPQAAPAERARVAAPES
jgi:hypothetical protein